MTTSVLKTRSKDVKLEIQKNAYFYDLNLQSANFRGNPLYQATKRHLNIVIWLVL